MDVHPTKNGMYSYWSIAIQCYTVIITINIPHQPKLTKLYDRASPCRKLLSIISTGKHRVPIEKQWISAVTYSSKGVGSWPVSPGWSYVPIRLLQNFTPNFKCLGGCSVARGSTWHALWQPGDLYLVGGFKHFLYSTIHGIILPIVSYFSRLLKPPTRYGSWLKFAKFCQC